MIVSLEALGSNTYNCYAMYPAGTIQSEFLRGLINLKFLHYYEYY